MSQRIIWIDSGAKSAMPSLHRLGEDGLEMQTEDYVVAVGVDGDVIAIEGSATDLRFWANEVLALLRLAEKGR
jgi:hypothetical protein